MTQAEIILHPLFHLPFKLLAV